MILRRVVFPVPLLPISATLSPFLISKDRSEKRGFPGKDLLKFSTLKTSLPLSIEGVIFILMELSSVGRSRRSILSKSFSLDSARFMDFSLLNCFNHFLLMLYLFLLIEPGFISGIPEGFLFFTEGRVVPAVGADAAVFYGKDLCNYPV